MRLIAGLGNPGPRYRNTRHNIGFEVLDRLAQRLDVTFDREKYRAQVAESVWASEKCLLLKPLTFMNLSGESLAKAARNRVDDPQHVLVIYDDTELPLGRLRLRKTGSAGTHNGMKSVIERLGTKDIPRIRVGVGGPPPGVSRIDFVLTTFAPDEREAVDEAVERAVEAALRTVEAGVDVAMNEFN